MPRFRGNRGTSDAGRVRWGGGVPRRPSKHVLSAPQMGKRESFHYYNSNQHFSEGPPAVAQKYDQTMDVNAGFANTLKGEMF